jgi:hypothetical protein
VAPDLIQAFRELNDVELHPGADGELLRTFESDSGLILPPEHTDVLLSTNGIEAYAGYLRLFGLYSTASVDAIAWNDQELWKFAWKDRCSPYWCFGGNAWGDQYAYSVESLRAGGDTKVCFVDALSMTPEVVADSFAKFMERELLGSARNPYDVMIKEARQKLGPLEMASLLVYVPSVLLGGTEQIGNVQKMNARSVMICNGDIAIQLDDGPVSGRVVAVEPYQDHIGRTRIQLIWE